MKKFLLTLTAIAISLPVLAFEDYVITTNGKLTDIKIQHNDIIDVYPLITVMNEKNTLIVHPLKEGETKFTVVKNGKDKYLFSVKVTEDKTEIQTLEGFGILSIDTPPENKEFSFDLDEPPVMKDAQFIINKRDEEFINTLDEPPVLRGE